jgi:hypothetical protein
MLVCGKHTCPDRCHALVDHSKIKCLQPVEVTCPKKHRHARACVDSGKSCDVCEREQREKRRRDERDARLREAQSSQEQAYRERLQAIDDAIWEQRDLRQARIKQHQQDITLAQREKDLAQAKRLTEDQSRSHVDQDATAQSLPITGGASQSAELPPVVLPTSEENALTLPSSQAASEWAYQKQYEAASNEHMDAIMAMIGLEDVKQQMLGIKTKIDTCVRQGTSLQNERFGAVLLGNPGTGKPLPDIDRGDILSSIRRKNDSRSPLRQMPCCDGRRIW